MFMFVFLITTINYTDKNVPAQKNQAEDAQKTYVAAQPMDTNEDMSKLQQQVELTDGILPCLYTMSSQNKQKKTHQKLHYIYMIHIYRPGTNQTTARRSQYTRSGTATWYVKHNSFYHGLHSILEHEHYHKTCL
jgi:hypothetical protein